MGVPFGGEVQGPIGGIPADAPPVAVGETLHGDGSEHGGQWVGVARLDASVSHAVGVDGLHPLLSLGAPAAAAPSSSALAASKRARAAATSGTSAPVRVSVLVRPDPV